MKSTALTVAAAAMVMFAQSAYAREHQHGHRHHHRPVASRSIRAIGSSDSVPPNSLFAFAAATAYDRSLTAYRGRG